MTLSGIVFISKPFGACVQIKMLIQVIGQDGKAVISWRRSITCRVVEISGTIDQEFLGQPGRPVMDHLRPGAGLLGTPDGLRRIVLGSTDSNHNRSGNPTFASTLL